MADKCKTIQIGDYLFNLTFCSCAPSVISWSNFSFIPHQERDMTEEEMEKGRKLRCDILEGKYKKLIDNTEWQED